MANWWREWRGGKARIATMFKQSWLIEQRQRYGIGNGQAVEAKVVDFNGEDKKISLSMKALDLSKTLENNAGLLESINTTN